MSEATTTYKVQTIFEAVDKTSKEVDEIGKSAKKSAAAVEGLQSTIKGMAGAFIGSKIFSEAKKSFIDYNSEMEQHKVKISGMLAMYTGADISKTWDRAGTSVARFEQMAKSSALTTKDLVDTASGLTRPLLQAGLSMKDIEKLSFGVANAGKAFGIEGGIVAMDIEQALTVGVHQRDRFSRNILAQMGLGKDGKGMDMEAFNALSTDKRVETLKKALTSKAILDMAKKQGEDTYAGVMSTVEDNFQILTSRIGKPLFRAITVELQDWNKWLDANSQKIDEISDVIREGLVTGFRFVKSAVGFIVDHADTLIQIGKVWAAVKLGGMAGNLLGSVGGSIGGMMSGAGSKVTAANALPVVGQALAFGYAIGTQLNEWTGATAKMSSVLEAIVPRTNAAAKEFYSISQSMDMVDAAIGNHKNAIGGQGMSNLLGQMDSFKADQAVVKRLMAASKAGDSDGIESANADLRARGISVSDLRNTKNWGSDGNYMGSQLINAQHTLADITLAQSSYFLDGFSKLTDVARENLNVDKAQRDIMEYMSKTETLRMMIQSKGGADAQAAIDKFVVAGILHNNSPEDLKGQGKINQTVNINIQQVMAKDPNKWLAEMDDMVAKKTRSRTRARGAWKGTSQ